MDKLKEEAVSIMGEIKIVGDSMSSKMQDLQSTANDIGSVAGKSLDTQMQLLDGQSRAMEGLNNLYAFKHNLLRKAGKLFKNLRSSASVSKKSFNSTAGRVQSKGSQHLCCPRQAVHPAQRHPCRFPLHQGLVLLLPRRVPHLHAHEREAEIQLQHQGPDLLWPVHHACAGNRADQDRRRRLQAVLDHVQGVPGQDGVPRRCHCPDPALHFHIQRRRTAEPPAAPDSSREGPSDGGERRRRCEGAAVRLHGGGGERSLMDYSWVFDELEDEVDTKMDPSYTPPQPVRARGRCGVFLPAAEEVGKNFMTTSVSRRYNLRARK